MEQVEASIERYLSALETADRQEGELAQAKSARLKDKIASLQEQMRKYKVLEVAVHAAPDKQISLTDPDARSMATSGKDTGLVGYNVQAEARQALGARSRPRRDAGAVRPCAQDHAHPTPDRGTSIRNHQGVDGRDPLPPAHP